MKRQKRLWTAAAACAVLGAACRAVPGVRFAGLLFWCLTALLIVFAMLEQYKEHAWAKWGKRVLLALVCLGLVAFGYLESLVIRGAHTDGRAEDAQCVVILGAGVNGTTPSLMLSSRLQAALDFIADKPDIPIICSGGQGPGEDISEADCMADWLIAHGVDESRIYREDRPVRRRTLLTAKRSWRSWGLMRATCSPLSRTTTIFLGRGASPEQMRPAAWRRRCRAAPITMPYSSTTMCGRPLPPVGSC